MKQDLDLPAFANAAGVAVCFENQCYRIGNTPDERQITELLAWLKDRDNGDVITFDSLPSVFPPAREYADVASGVLGFSFSGNQASYFLWFRPEVLETVHWAGNPNKPVQVENGESRLQPRVSFELWKETVQGKSTPWTTSETEAAFALRNALFAEILARTSRELEQMNRKLLQSNRDLDSFAYVISHDLTALIRRVRMYAELLERNETIDTEGRDYLARTREISHRMDQLVNDVLIVSRVSSEQKVFAPVDLNRLVEQVQADLQDEFRQAGGTFKAPPLPVIQAQETQMYQLFQNLIGNALKYRHHERPPVLALDVALMDHGYHFQLRDNGIGFSQEEAGQIFDLFQRLKGGKERSGSGIGLAICKRIVERHQGKIWVEGRPGEGATFHFFLPRGMPEIP
jgi:chemotaxis family two-component system sensor kinase Cph1